jgi:hypothetical protein
MTDVALTAAVVTAVTIFVTWSCRRLGRFGRQVLGHLSSFAGLPAAVELLAAQLRDALVQLNTDREDFAARIGRVEEHLGVTPC